MIHVSVDVYLRKNKVPETSTQPLRVFISRARTRQSFTGVIGNYNIQEGDIFFAAEGAQLPLPHLQRRVHSHQLLSRKHNVILHGATALNSSLNHHLRSSLRLFQRLLKAVFAFFIYKQAEQWVIQPSY